MKKTFRNIRTLAALLMAGAAFAACSSSDDNVIEQQPANPGEQVYTLTVNATKDGGSQTRALKLDGEKLVASWKTTDNIAVIKVSPSYSSVGFLNPTNISADGNSATLTGEVTGVAADDDLILSYHYHDISAFANQNGRLKDNAYSAEEYDMAEATVTVANVNGTNITTTTDANFVTQTAMIKFTLQDNAATPNKINATSLNVKATITLPSPLSGSITEDIITFTPTADTYIANGGNGILYFALPSAATLAGPIVTKLKADPYNLTTITESDVVSLLTSAKVTFLASDGTNTYNTTKTGYPFAAGSYYTSTLSMANVLKNLSTLTADYVAQYGDVLTGTLGNNVMISIADGATVTLNNVDINGSATWLSTQHAGLTCEGDATIILADGSTNTVLAYHQNCPGIRIPSGKTLTIKGGTAGTGKLNAYGGRSGSDPSSTGRGAGIGGGYSGTSNDCGNIVIEGGDIIAIANGGAGIGCGYTTNCGDITIKGGTVHASSTSWYPGIGSGNSKSCGNITISGGNVTATSTGAAGIGCGYYNSTCGDITISGGTVTATGGKGAAGAAAGIGGAYTNDENLSNCGNILITGGTVTATGGTNAGVAGGAGIGTGTRCKSGTITIQGGSITATGGDNAAGIGAGTGGICGSITITDGVTFVDANKGTGSPYDIGIATDLDEPYISAIKDGDTPGSVTIAASVVTSDGTKHYTDGDAAKGYNKHSN